MQSSIVGLLHERVFSSFSVESSAYPQSIQPDHFLAQRPKSSHLRPMHPASLIRFGRLVILSSDTRISELSAFAPVYLSPVEHSHGPPLKPTIPLSRRYEIRNFLVQRKKRKKPDHVPLTEVETPIFRAHCNVGQMQIHVTFQSPIAAAISLQKSSRPAVAPLLNSNS